MLEWYGTVYSEAMAAGLPVIGGSAGILAHLTRHGVEGLAVPPGDRVAASGRAEHFPAWDETAPLLFSELRAVVA